jgi:DNA polymerase I-like protein with 3'-5' exonuclease and polymerase domains
MKILLNRIPKIPPGIDEIGVDTETAKNFDKKHLPWKGLTPFDQHLVIISLWIPSTDTSYILEWNKLKDNPVALEALAKILGNKGIKKWFHNAVFDLHFLIENGFTVNNVGCSMVLSQMYFCGDYSKVYKKVNKQSPFGLGSLTRSLYNIDLDKQKQQKDWDDFNPEEDSEYVGLDAKYCVLIGKTLENWLSSCKYLNYEVGCIEALGRMNANGLRFDSTGVRDYREKVNKGISDLHNYLDSLGEVNLRSPKQVIEFFKCRFGFDVPFITDKDKKVKQSTSKPHMNSWGMDDLLAEKLAVTPKTVDTIVLHKEKIDKKSWGLINKLFFHLLKTIDLPVSFKFLTFHKSIIGGLGSLFKACAREILAECMREFISVLRELRFLNYLSTVLDHFDKQQFIKGDRIRTIFQPLAFDRDNDEGNGMGRTSTMSGCLPLQIIPKRSKYLKKYGNFRKLFVAEEGYKIVSLDVAGSHAVIARELTKDKTLLKAKEEGLKIHYYTCAEIAKLEGLYLSPVEIKEIIEAEDTSDPQYLTIKYLYGLSKEVIYSKLNAAGKESIKLSLYKSEIAITDDLLDGIDKLFNSLYSGLRKYGYDMMNKAKYRCAELPKLPHSEPLGKLSRNEVALTGQPIWINPFVKANRVLSAQWLVSEAAALKMFLYRADRIIQEEGIDAKILGYIHDELIFEIEESIAPDFTQRLHSLLYDCMNEVIPGFGYTEESVDKLIKDSW